MRIAKRRIEALMERRLPGWRLAQRLQDRDKSTVWRIEKDDDVAALKYVALWFRDPVHDIKFLRDHGDLIDTPSLVRCREWFEETVMRGTRRLGVILMDYHPTTMKAYARRHRPLPADEIRRLMTIMVTLCRDLKQQTDLIHWDLKPSNILMDKKGQAGVLADYGGLQLPKDGILRAQYTDDYVPPERWFDDPNHGEATLAYTIGLSGYRIAQSRPPHPDLEIPDRFKAMAEGDLDLSEEDRARIGDMLPVLEKCLRRDPAERYQSFEAILADLAP